MARINVSYRNMRLMHKLLLSYSVIFTIPIIVLAIYSYTQSKSFMEQHTMLIMENISSTITQGIDEKFRKYDSLVSYLSFDKKIERIAANRYDSYYELYYDYSQYLDPFLYSILLTNSDINKIAFYSGNGLVERGLSVDSRIFFLSMDTLYSVEAAANLNPYGMTSWVLRENTVAVYKRIYIQFNDYDSGFASLELDAGSIFESVKDFPYSGVLFSVNNEGKILYENSQGASIPANEGTMKHEGRNYLVFISVMEAPGWEMRIAIPADAETQDIQSITSVMIIIILCCLVPLFIITILFSSSFEKRIRVLNETIGAVENGNLNLAVSSEYTDEIGELTNKFGKMLGQLNVLIAKMVRNETERKELEFKALQAQINPHFLYNSLSLINWEAKMTGNDKISLITVLLSRFYRKMLNRGKAQIQIKDEIENAIAYVEIQRIMHENMFDAEFDIDEAILNSSIISFTLQPILENAIEHGVLQLKDKKGMIKVIGRSNGDKVVIEVSDNGPGIIESEINDIFTKDDLGYGIKNVNGRIQLYFGKEYGLVIRSGNGTIVTITVPGL